MNFLKLPKSQVIEPKVTCTLECSQKYHPYETHHIFVVQRWIYGFSGGQHIRHIDNSVYKHYSHRDWEVTQVERDPVHAVVNAQHHNRGDVIQIKGNVLGFYQGEEHRPEEQCNNYLKGQTRLIEEDTPLPEAPW